MTELAALPSRTLPPQPAAPVDEPALIPTRFGELAVSPERLIAFPTGVLGFTDCQRYALADLPDPQVVFKLLQSVDTPELAFLVLPLDPVAGPIGRGDLERACGELGFDWQALVVLGIVTIRSDPEGVRFSINLAAGGRRRPGAVARGAATAALRPSRARGAQLPATPPGPARSCRIA